MAVASAELVVGGAAPRSGDVRIRDTYWGYVIEEERDRFERETLLEAWLRFLGLVLVMSAYGQWLLPASLFSGDAFVMKSALAFALGLTGVVLYWFANRGLATEVQVDLAKRELRVSRRNSRGQTRLMRVIPIRQIKSAYVMRSAERFEPSDLYLRFRDSEDVLRVASGNIEDLERLLRRLSADLQPMRDRIDQRLAHSLPFQTRRSY